MISLISILAAIIITPFVICKIAIRLFSYTDLIRRKTPRLYREKYKVTVTSSEYSAASIYFTWEDVRHCVRWHVESGRIFLSAGITEAALLLHRDQMTRLSTPGEHEQAYRIGRDGGYGKDEIAELFNDLIFRIESRSEGQPFIPQGGSGWSADNFARYIYYFHSKHDWKFTAFEHCVTFTSQTLPVTTVVASVDPLSQKVTQITLTCDSPATDVKEVSANNPREVFHAWREMHRGCRPIFGLRHPIEKWGDRWVLALMPEGWLYTPQNTYNRSFVFIRFDGAKDQPSKIPRRE